MFDDVSGMTVDKSCDCCKNGSFQHSFFMFSSVSSQRLKTAKMNGKQAKMTDAENIRQHTLNFEFISRTNLSAKSAKQTCLQTVQTNLYTNCANKPVCKPQTNLSAQCQQTCLQTVQTNLSAHCANKPVCTLCKQTCLHAVQTNLSVNCANKPVCKLCKQTCLQTANCAGFGGVELR